MTEIATLTMQSDNRLALSGDLTFVTVPEIWKQSLVLFSTIPELNFDLTEVKSSNSAGLALLIEWLKYAKTQNKKISFQHVPTQLKSLIQAAGVEKLFNHN